MKPTRSALNGALRLVVTTVLATSAVLVPVGTASAADTEAPVLSSFSVSTHQVTTGQQVTFSYVATEGAGSLSLLRLHYKDSLGHSDAPAFPGTLLVAGSVSFTVPNTWANGPIVLGWIELTDPSGNRILCNRNGTTSVSAGATGQSSHALQLASADLTVSGSTADVTIPSLTSVSVTGSPARPGETISVHYDATDAAGALGSIAFWFRDAYQIARPITPARISSRPLKGSIDVVLPEYWPNGTYLLTSVEVSDPHGNTGRYLSTGMVNISPVGASGPTSHAVDFGPATFTVSGSTADFTPPALTSLKVAGSPMAPGGTALLSYTAESQDPLTYVSFRYAGPVDYLGNQTVFGKATSQLLGTQAVSFPVAGYKGVYTLLDIYLRDSVGNTITYHRDGTTSQGPGVLTGTHSLAMRTMDLLVGTPPSAPRMLGAQARSASAAVFWDPADQNGSPVSRYTITATPGGRTVTTSGSARRADLTGLTNNTTYRFTVKATNAIGTGPASTPSNAVTPRMSTSILDGRDFNGDGRDDLIALRSPTDARDDRIPYLYLGNGRSGFLAGTTKLSSRLGDKPTVFSSGDFGGDARNDVLAVHGSGDLELHHGNGRGGFSEGQVIGTGWGSFLRVFSPGDFSGDRRNDVLAVGRDGGLYLYRGNGQGGWAAAGQRIGTGWANFLTVFSPRDFTGDGKPDVMAVSKDGGMYLYRGNGRGGFAAAGQKIGSGWGSFLSVSSGGDFSGDHKPDVLAVSTTGVLYLYRGNGRGGWASGAQKIGTGWNIYR